MEQSYQKTDKPFFFKALYSNTELLKTNTYSIWKTLFILLVNISLIAAPFFMSRYGNDPEKVYQYLPGIETALIELYQEELPCEVAGSTLSCTGLSDQTIALTGYTLYVLPSAETTQSISGSSIIFGSSAIVISYSAPDPKDDFTLEGNYRLLDGMDFSSVNREALQMTNYTETEFYDYINSTFILNVYNSELGSAMSIIYLTQFAQTILYAVLLALFLLAANLKRNTKKVFFSSSFKFTVVGMTGPALLACLIGLLSTVFGTILFAGIYAVRMILFYMLLNKTKGTF